MSYGTSPALHAKWAVMRDRFASAENQLVIAKVLHFSVNGKLLRVRVRDQEAWLPCALVRDQRQILESDAYEFTVPLWWARNVIVEAKAKI